MSELSFLENHSKEKIEILIVEDDPALREKLKALLEENGFHPSLAEDGLDAIHAVEERIQLISSPKKPFQLVIMDVNMPRLGGLEALKKLKELDPSLLIIMMTAYSTIEDAVQAVKDGAYNYLAKPIKESTLVEMVTRSLQASEMVHSLALSAPIVKWDDREFISNTEGMKKIFNIIGKLAKVDTSVLIRGESGTGKELVARAIHYNSMRKEKKLVAINCSSIAETLFESELFGHEKGAFTGADARQIGRFQYADGGTIFLDEIGDLSMAMQVKLLRVLQERKFTPVGSNREIGMDVRIIAATNRNLEELIAKNQFREDLFYRLNVIPIFLPPLRERKDDLERLISHFVFRFNTKHQKKIQRISKEALEVLWAHHWPGNIRELENVIEHAMVIEGSHIILKNSLPSYLLQQTQNQVSEDSVSLTDKNLHSQCNLEMPNNNEESSLDYKLHKEEFEKSFIIKALRTFRGKINQTAIHAKIPKKTLLRKITKYKIRTEDYKE